MTKLQEEQIRSFFENCMDLKYGIPEDSIIELFTSEAFGMTKSQVKHFLNRFKEEGLIEPSTRIFWKYQES